MHKKSVEKDPSLKQLYTKLKSQYPRSIGIYDFVKWTSENPSVLSPLLMLQLHIRLQILGENFWKSYAEDRAENEEQSNPYYLKKLQKFVIDKNNKFKEKKLAVEREKKRLSRIGKGEAGDHRDNVTRKESIFLAYFNLKAISRRRLTSYIQRDMKNDAEAAKIRRRRSYAKKPKLVKKDKQEKGNKSKKSKKRVGPMAAKNQ